MNTSTSALLQPRLRCLVVPATVACSVVTIFGSWWEARVAPEMNSSEFGRSVGSIATKLGLLAAVVLLGALLSAFQSRAGAGSLLVGLCVVSIGVSGVAAAGVIAWLVRHPEHADLLWRSFGL